MELAANEPGQPPLNAPHWRAELPTPASALAIGAHPDDVEFGAGATLARWAADGCTVHHLICTDGSKGTWDPEADIAALVATRRDEQRAAAAALGAAGEVAFLDQVDGELTDSAALRSAVAAVIRRLRPEVVLAHDPWKRYRLHPDHRAAGFLACDAIVAARDPHFFPEHRLAPHRPAALLLFEADEPDYASRVDTLVETKIAALCAHTSQFRSTMKAVDSDQLEAFRRRVRERLADLGAPFGWAAAELFKLIDDL